MGKRMTTNFFKKTSLNKKTKNLGKKGVAIESLVWWLIAIAVLGIALVLVFVLREKLFSIGDYLKNLFRFRS